MSKNELSILLQNMREVDHWDMLGELSSKLSILSEQVSVIHHSIDLSEIGKVRQEFAPALVETSILIEALKIQLSVMPDEWNRLVDAVVAEMNKEYEVDYSNEEF